MLSAMSPPFLLRNVIVGMLLIPYRLAAFLCLYIIWITHIDFDWHELSGEGGDVCVCERFGIQPSTRASRIGVEVEHERFVGFRRGFHPSSSDFSHWISASAMCAGMATAISKTIASERWNKTDLNISFLLFG